MSFRKKDFINEIATNTTLRAKFKMDPKAVLSQFGLKVTDAQARNIKEQIDKLMQEGKKMVDINKFFDWT